MFAEEPDGRPTGEHRNFIDAATPLLELYGDRDVNTFGCPELERVRDHMKRVGCRSDEPNRREKRLTITTINSRVQRIRRMFRWGVPKRLVPASVLVDLEQLEHLKRGRSRDAKDPKNVEPVSWADVQAVLPHLPPTLRAMVLVQWHSGARPSEICNLRPMDIDRSGGEVWVYRPSTHKTEHLNKVRAIPLDQEAQAALRPLLARVPPPAPEQLLFSVSQAQAERAVANRAERRTKVQPSQEDRSGGRRRASHHYTTNSYRNAIHYAIEALNGETRRRAIIDAVVGEVPSRDDGLFTRYLETLPNQIKREHIARALGRAARRSPTPSNLNRLIEVGVGALHEVKVTGFWGPHQIRHAFGFRIVPQLGVEHARALMGHSDIRTTMRYAKSDVEKAFEALYQSRG